MEAGNDQNPKQLRITAGCIQSCCIMGTCLTSGCTKNGYTTSSLDPTHEPIQIMAMLIDFNDNKNTARRRDEGIRLLSTNPQINSQYLMARVDDWRGLAFKRFGAEVLCGAAIVIRATQRPREMHIYLFENILLCCKEKQPKLAMSKLQREEPLSSLEAQQLTLTPLRLKGRIHATSILGVSHMEASTDVGVCWKDDAGEIKTFVMRFREAATTEKWVTALRACSNVRDSQD